MRIVNFYYSRTVLKEIKVMYNNKVEIIRSIIDFTSLAIVINKTINEVVVIYEDVVI